MKCLVCRKEFSGRECPVCQFPVIEFPGDTEDGLRTLEPTIKKFSNEFSAGIRIGSMVCSWAVSEDKTLMESEWELDFGTAAAAMEEILWCGREFDNPTERNTVEARIFVRIKDKRYTIAAEIPNIPEAESTELGISLDADFNVTVYIRDGSGNVRSSEKYYLFGEN